MSFKWDDKSALEFGTGRERRDESPKPEFAEFTSTEPAPPENRIISLEEIRSRSKPNIKTWLITALILAVTSLLTILLIEGFRPSGGVNIELKKPVEREASE